LAAAAAVGLSSYKVAYGPRLILLDAIRRYINSQSLQNGGAMTTEKLVAWLLADRARPFKSFPGDPDRQLALALKQFGIRPDHIRFGEEVRRGYRVEWFEDAFKRHLPDQNTVTIVTSVTKD
jgi:hypothetical protein